MLARFSFKNIILKPSFAFTTHLSGRQKACLSVGNTTRGVFRLSDCLNIAGKWKIKA